MLNRLFVAISLVALSLLPHLATAQTFACQYISDGGLHWEAGRWKATLFNAGKPFFLKMDGGSLDRQSVASALGASALAEIGGVFCQREPIFSNVSCLIGTGKFLYFDPKTGNGGRALLFGASQDNRVQTADSLSVAPFTCQKM